MAQVSFKDRLKKGPSALGCLANMGSAIAAEILAASGYDSVMVDLEHGPGDILNAIHQMQAITAGGAVPLLRVPDNDPVWLKRALDSGPAGIMVPAIGTVDAARAAVQGSRLRLKAQGSRLRFKDPGPRSKVQGPGSRSPGSKVQGSGFGCVSGAPRSPGSLIIISGVSSFSGKGNLKHHHHLRCLTSGVSSSSRSPGSLIIIISGVPPQVQVSHHHHQ